MKLDVPNVNQKRITWVIVHGEFWEWNSEIFVLINVNTIQFMLLPVINFT